MTVFQKLNRWFWFELRRLWFWINVCARHGGEPLVIEVDGVVLYKSKKALYPGDRLELTTKESST